MNYVEKYFLSLSLNYLDDIHFYFYSSKNGFPTKNDESTSGQGLRLEHGLVVVGFVIGFGFVFAVGLLYAKVQRVRRFKLLDNTNGKCIS